MKQVKRVISLIVSLILLATSVVFATEENQVCQNSRKSLGESENLIIMPGNVEINGAPAGVKFGEDSEYYYVRTKIRLYSDAAYTNSVTEWKTVYHKKSKSSGAAVEGEQI